MIYKKAKNPLFLACASLLLFGCGTIQKPTSSYSLQRFATPEVAEEGWKPSLQIGFAEMHKVVLPDSANAKPSYDCNSAILCVENDPYFFQGNLSVISGLEFAFNSQLNRVSATWQFFGDFHEHAEAGNISQALVLGVSRHSESDTYVGNFDIEIPNGFTQHSWDQTTTSIDFGWVAGYRINENWLLYGGPFITLHDIDNSVTAQTDLDKIQQHFNFKGRQLGTNIALKYKAFSWLDVDLEFVSAKYELNDGSTNNNQFNLMFGTRF